MKESNVDSEHEWLNDAGQMMLMLKKVIGASNLPQDVPGYQLIKKIAAGAQGTVYEATQNGNEQAVAVKVLNQRTFPTSRVAARLQRGIDLGKRLDHPGIVRILDSGMTATGRPFLVMDMLTGGTLNEAVPFGGSWPRWQGLADTLQLFLKICEAVEHAHMRGVLHRDLKPGNVLFDEHGMPRVADFGLAKDLEKPSPEIGLKATLTRDGEMVGTPAYSAPEQFALTDEADVDIRSDVFSLGAILYQLLCGKLPLPMEGSMLDVLQRLRVERPQPLTKVFREQFLAGALPPFAPHRLPPELDAITQMALAKEKGRRYQSVAEFAKDIEAFLKRQPLLARRESRRRATWRWIKSHRAATAGILVFVTTLSTIAVVNRQLALDANTQRQHSQDIASMLLGQGIHALSQLPGGGRHREEMIQNFLDKTNEMLRQFPDDSALLNNRALALIELGSRQRELGKTAQARISFSNALADFMVITRDEGADPEYFHGKSIALVKMGDYLKEQGHTPQGRANYRKALELDLWLTKKHPDFIGGWDNLMWSYQRHCDLAAIDKNLSAAEDYLTRMNEVIGRLRRNDQEKHRTEIAHIQAMKSSVFLAKLDNDLDLALEWLQSATQFAARLYRADETHLGNALEYVRTLTQLQALQNEIGLPHLAEMAAVDARLIFNQLSQSDPQNIDVIKSDLHFSFYSLPARFDRGSHEQELEHCHELLETVFRYSTDRPDLLGEAIGSCLFLANRLHGTPHFEVAMKFADTLIPMVERAEFLADDWENNYQALLSLCDKLPE